MSKQASSQNKDELLQNAKESLQNLKEFLKKVDETATEYTSMLNELIYNLTADYRKDNPEANEAFFEEYPAAKQYKEQD